MKLDFGEYRITTDERQFVIQQKKIVKEGEFTKEGKAADPIWVDIGYCPSLKFALKFINTKVLLDNDDLILIISELKEIENKITELLKLLKQEAR